MQATFPAGTPAPPISKVLGQMWKGMSREAKLPYFEAQQADIAQRLGEREALILSRPVRLEPQRSCVILSLLSS